VRRALWKRLIDEALVKRRSNFLTESNSKNLDAKEQPKVPNGYSMCDERGLLIPFSALSECPEPSARSTRKDGAELPKVSPRSSPRPHRETSTSQNQEAIK